MASVWYIGWSDSRVIHDQDWDAAGVSDLGDFTWDGTNGFSIPQAEFTVNQVAWLRSQNDFLCDAPDGPRTVIATATDGFITEADLRRILASTDFNALGLTKSSVGLDQVDNTSDLSKPLSTAAIAALAGKIDYPSGGSDGQVLTKSGSTTAWIAPAGSGSLGITPVADSSVPSGTVYTIDGTGVAAVSDASVPSGTVYMIN